MCFNCYICVMGYLKNGRAVVHRRPKGQSDWSWGTRRQYTLNEGWGCGVESAYTSRLEGAESEPEPSYLESPRFLSAYEQLPRNLQIIYDLFYKSGMRQHEIADVFGITQGAVSFRLKSAQARLKVLIKKPETPDREWLIHFLGQERADIAWHFIEITSSQIETARYMTEHTGRRYGQLTVRAMHVANKRLAMRYLEMSKLDEDTRSKVKVLYDWLVYGDVAMGTRSNRGMR